MAALGRPGVAAAPAGTRIVGPGGQNGGMKPLAWSTLRTPAGPLSVGCSQTDVARVRFGPAGAASQAGTSGEPGAALARLARDQLAEYLTGRRRAFELPLDWGDVPDASRRVLGTLLESVGYGQTITYGELARCSGLSGIDLPARVVGQIMGANRLPLLIPCHRVVASDGIGGYSGGTGIEAKRWLLILEGVLPPTLDWEPALARC